MDAKRFPFPKWEDLIPFFYGVTATIPIGLLYNSSLDPLPGQTADFGVAVAYAGGAMAITDVTITMFFPKASGKTRKNLEFLAAATPAVIGTLYEFYSFLSDYSNVFDWKDIIAYFTGAFFTYFGVHLLKKVGERLK